MKMLSQEELKSYSEKLTIFESKIEEIFYTKNSWKKFR